jgi:hypothetical protein
MRDENLTPFLKLTRAAGFHPTPETRPVIIRERRPRRNPNFHNNPYSTRARERLCNKRRTPSGAEREDFFISGHIQKKRRLALRVPAAAAAPHISSALGLKEWRFSLSHSTIVFMFNNSAVCSSRGKKKHTLTTVTICTSGVAGQMQNEAINTPD